MKRALAFLVVAAVGGCSFLCIPGGNCITDCDCGTGFVCSADAGGICIAGPADGGCGFPIGTSSGTTSGSGTSGFTTAGTTSGLGSATTGTSSTSGASSCEATGSCCGSAWATENALCGTALGSAQPGSLYVTTNDSDGIYRFNPGSAASTTLIAQSELGANLDALTVTNTDPSSPSFVYALDFAGLAQMTNGTETALPSMGDESPDGIGVAFLAGSNLLAIASGDGVAAYAFPPTNGVWGANLWSNANASPSSNYSFPIGQLVVTGASQSTAVGASSIGAIQIASDGDICFSQGCSSPPGLSGTPTFTGSAVDFSTGTLYVVGSYADPNDMNDGVVSAVDGNTGACLWTAVGNAAACNTANALPFTCGGNCHTDLSLAQVPLLQAGFLGGTLYVTELGVGGGGSIASYSLAGGLKVQVQDSNLYYSMAVGP